MLVGGEAALIIGGGSHSGAWCCIGLGVVVLMVMDPAVVVVMKAVSLNATFYIIQGR